MNRNSENNEDGFRLLVEDEAGAVFVVDENWVDKCVVEDEGENDEDGAAVFVDHDWEGSNDGEENEDQLQGETKLMDSEDDILNMGELNLFSPHEIKNWEFGNLDVAFKFYFEYAKANGFSIRKGRTLRNKKTLEMYQKEFLCSRVGTREDRGLRMEDRVREPRAVTRCHMRFKEKEDDFTSIHGDPVMQSRLQSLESYAARVYTRRVIFLFRRVLHRASQLVVTGYTQAVRCPIFTVRGQSVQSYECRVSVYPSTKEIKCGCLKMESRGLPCEHIIAVLNHLGIDEIPDSLVLKRWTKGAKDGICGEDGERYETWDAARSTRRAALNGWYDQVSCFKAETIEKYNIERDRIFADLKECRAEKAAQEERCGFSGNVASDTLRNPVRAATKGSGVATSSSGIRVRRKQNCSICKLPGHNKLTCPRGAQQYQPRQQGGAAGTSNTTEHDDVFHNYEEFDPDNMDTSSSFGGNSSSSNNMGFMAKKCKFGKNVAMITSWTEYNPGRRFLGCANYRESTTHCDYFAWFDPPSCERYVKIMNSLLKKNNNLQTKISEHKHEIGELKNIIASQEVELVELKMKVVSFGA
ncbi:Zinc finger, PMZ-type [Sesbania bispinosa]|nr:Zinc finger, PMZ-type [Sesbania bispinosa]